MTGITFTGASTYQFTGSTLATQAQIGRTGVAFGAGTTFGGNLIFGTGSDQGTFIFKPSEFQLTASSTGTVTVNNGMDVLLNATGNITQDFILHGMGTSNILGTLDAQNTQNGTVTTLSGTIGLASDASIQASQNNGTSLTVTGTISSSNGSNLYLDYDSANSNTTSGATTYANATKLIIGGTGGSGSGTNSYGSTIISNSGNGDNGALNGGITGEAVMIGKDNALSTAGALILGVSGTTAVTLGDGTVITAPNSTNLTYGAGNVVTYTTSDGALDLNGHNQSFTGLVTNSALTASNQFIGNNSGIGTSTLTVTGNTSLATGFGGIIEDNFAAQQSVTGQAGGKVAFKVTSGAIKLTGANAYSGGTTVSGGTLTAGVASTSTTSAFGTPSSAMAVSGTGTLALNGFSQTFGAMTLSGSGIVSFGATGTTLSATSLNWAGGASDFALNLGAAYVTTSALTVGSLTESGTPHSYTFNFTGGTVGTTYDVMNLTSLGAAAATDFTSTGEAGTFTFSGNQLQFTLGATPEPSTWAMLLGGVALLVLSQRRLRGGSERL